MDDSQAIVYLDNNATTPIDPRVLEAMMPYFSNNFANASSVHKLGINANNSVKRARFQVSNLLGAEPNEIVFTSGSTEAINIAIKGIAENYAAKGKHIVTSSTEHSAVLDTCKYLETKGYEITYLPVKANGIIDLSELKNVLRNDTILVCIMYVNNETGVLQPVNEISQLTHAAGAFYMCDATQAVGKIEVNVDELGIDLLCMSGHKFYAPKGIGALYVRQGINPVKLTALFQGGGHENGLRSGTLNVPGIVALGCACEIARDEMKQVAERIFIMRNKLENELLKISGTFLNGKTENRIFNVSNICFPGFDANVMIGRMKNVAVSNGSACSSATIEPSHVLTAMGLNDDDAFASIRFSLGRFNTENEIQTVVKLFNELFRSSVNYA
jgi:cysteine desulfurase